MRNENPQECRCAICRKTGGYRDFAKEGQTLNWVETWGRLYLVCNGCIDSTYIVDGKFGPIFNGLPGGTSPQQALYRQVEHLAEEIASLRRRCDFYDNNGNWNQ